MQMKIWSNVLLPLAFVATAIVPKTVHAQAKTVSDAQVEANVLKAFAEDTRLANQPINTSAVYGTVTLTGSVTNEGARDAAEQIASRTVGVKKVVDQLAVGVAPVSADSASQKEYSGTAMPAAQGRAEAAQSADPADGNLAPGSQPAQQLPQDQPSGQPVYGQQSPSYGQQSPSIGQQSPSYGQQSQPYGQQQPGYGEHPYSQNDDSSNPYGQQQGSYPQPQQRRLYRRDYERQMANGQQQPYGQQYANQGQPGGQLVTVPGGSVLPVSINRWISSGDAAPGSTFTAIVANDVLAGGQIAIPRGATVEGTVLDAKGAGVLKGRGSLTLQLNMLDLGGQRIPLQSDAFTVNGRDKTAQSVNSTLIGAGIGALLGAAIGRGTGAAIGAGVGGAAGLGSSAASNGGQATVPSEALLRFRLTAPLPVTTVSEAEMQRLGGYAGPSNGYRGEPGRRPVPTVGVYAYPSPYGYAYPYYRRGFYRGGYWY